MQTHRDVARHDTEVLRRPGYEQTDQRRIGVREAKLASLSSFRPICRNACRPEWIVEKPSGLLPSRVPSRLASPLLGGATTGGAALSGLDIAANDADSFQLLFGQVDAAAPSREGALRHRDEPADLAIGQAGAPQLLADLASLPLLQVGP